MTRLELRAPDLKNVMRRFLDRLREHREALNRLNVYPVPDGDTGTNMALTVESVMAECDGASSMTELAEAIAHGSLMGAQGNSGIILSQILRGLADSFRDETTVGTAQLVEALDRASEAAYQAVGRPVEGTILTVVREAAEAAAEVSTPEGESLAALLTRVYERGADALQRTPELLPVLAQAGVVDAGGAGLLLLLAAFLEEVTGAAVTLPLEVFQAAAQLEVAPAEDDLEANLSGLRYEVMYLLDADGSAGERLREAWADLGDSIVVVGGEGLWNCHVHTDHIGPAIEAGIALGRPHRIKVTDLLAQADAVAAEAAFEPEPGVVDAPVGVVAVAAGKGIAELFRAAGAQGLVVGGQTMNPSVRTLLEAVEAAPADAIVVLPNNKNIIPVAEQLDALTDKTVHVVPTRTVPQGLAAMLAYMPGEADAETVTTTMASAAAQIVSGEVTQAVRKADTPIGPVEEGDWMGLVDGTVAAVSPDLSGLVDALLGVMVGEDAELVTVYVGEGASGSESIEAWVAAHRPDIEVESVDGGQPLYPYLLSVE